MKYLVLILILFTTCINAQEIHKATTGSLVNIPLGDLGLPGELLAKFANTTPTKRPRVYYLKDRKRYPKVLYSDGSLLSLGINRDEVQGDYSIEVIYEKKSYQLGVLEIVPPHIDDTTDIVKPGDEIILKGKYFGKKPKFYLKNGQRTEYCEIKKIITKSTTTKNTYMNPSTGESIVKVKIPTSLMDDDFLYVENNVGQTSVDINKKIPTIKSIKKKIVDEEVCINVKFNLNSNKGHIYLEYGKDFAEISERIKLANESEINIEASDYLSNQFPNIRVVISNNSGLVSKTKKFNSYNAVGTWGIYERDGGAVIETLVVLENGKCYNSYEYYGTWNLEGNVFYANLLNGTKKKVHSYIITEDGEFQQNDQCVGEKLYNATNIHIGTWNLSDGKKIRINYHDDFCYIMKPGMQQDIFGTWEIEEVIENETKILKVTLDFENLGSPIKMEGTIVNRKMSLNSQYFNSEGDLVEEKPLTGKLTIENKL